MLRYIFSSSVTLRLPILSFLCCFTAKSPSLVITPRQHKVSHPYEAGFESGRCVYTNNEQAPLLCPLETAASALGDCIVLNALNGGERAVGVSVCSGVSAARKALKAVPNVDPQRAGKLGLEGLTAPTTRLGHMAYLSAAICDRSCSIMIAGQRSHGGHSMRRRPQ